MRSESDSSDSDRAPLAALFRVSEDLLFDPRDFRPNAAFSRSRWQKSAEDHEWRSWLTLRVRGTSPLRLKDMSRKPSYVWDTLFYELGIQVFDNFSYSFTVLADYHTSQ